MRAAGLCGELLVGDDAVDQPPLKRLRGGDAFAEHRHLGGARHAHAGGHEQRGAPVGHQADVDEGKQEVGALRGDHEVAAERQRAADACGGAVDAGHHRQRQLADRVHDRVVALGQHLVDVGPALGGLLDAEVLQVGAGGEGASGARDHHGARRVVLACLPQCGEQVAAELLVPRVQRLRAVELDRGDPVGVDRQVDCLESGVLSVGLALSLIAGSSGDGCVAGVRVRWGGLGGLVRWACGYFVVWVCGLVSVVHVVAVCGLATGILWCRWHVP